MSGPGIRALIDTIVTTSWISPQISIRGIVAAELRRAVARPLRASFWSKGGLRSRRRGWSRRGGEISFDRSGWRARSWSLSTRSAVLTHVAAMGTIGVRCMFGTRVEEEIPDDYVWKSSRPRIDDWLLSIGGFEIHETHYADYIRALRGLSDQIGSTVDVTWRDQNTEAIQTARVLVQRPPSWTYYRSCVWFLQEMLIFAIGARVFWKRPDDESAQLFFAVCIVTVGAFMGGYHWTEIVTEPWLIYPFALVCGVRAGGQSAFLSGLSRGRIRCWCGTSGGCWGRSTGSRPAYLLALWASMLAARWFSFHQGGSQTAAAFQVLRWLALGYIGWRPFCTGSASTAWSSATATRRPAASATRCAGSCGRR